MSVECKMYVGFTVELAKNLTHADFRKCDEFTDKYPELDEYRYPDDEKEGKLILVADGMNGDFLRLIKVDKYIDGASLGDANEFVELKTPGVADPELMHQIEIIYEAYTGEKLNLKDVKYAMWSQWY